MKWLLLTSILLIGCENIIGKSVDDLFIEEKKCAKIALFLEIEKFSYEKINEDYLCTILVPKNKTIVLYDSELNAMGRLILIKEALKSGNW